MHYNNDGTRREGLFMDICPWPLSLIIYFLFGYLCHLNVILMSSRPWTKLNNVIGPVTCKTQHHH